MYPFNRNNIAAHAAFKGHAHFQSQAGYSRFRIIEVLLAVSQNDTMNAQVIYLGCCPYAARYTECVVCACVDSLNDKINEVKVRAFIGFQLRPFLDLQNNASFSAIAYLQCHCSLCKV